MRRESFGSDCCRSATSTPGCGWPCAAFSQMWATCPEPGIGTPTRHPHASRRIKLPQRYHTEAATGQIQYERRLEISFGIRRPGGVTARTMPTVKIIAKAPLRAPLGQNVEKQIPLPGACEFAITASAVQFVMRRSRPFRAGKYLRHHTSKSHGGRIVSPRFCALIA
jgi:hypothetical protein